MEIPEKTIKKFEELITKDGIKVSGNGIIIKRLKKMTELQDKTNLKLHWLEDKVIKLTELIETKNI